MFFSTPHLLIIQSLPYLTVTPMFALTFSLFSFILFKTLPGKQYKAPEDACCRAVPLVLGSLKGYFFRRDLQVLCLTPDAEHATICFWTSSILSCFPDTPYSKVNSLSLPLHLNKV